MKTIIKLTLLIICILIGMRGMSQQECKDAVHPTENRKSILDCCINDIKNGNVVVYTKKSKTYEVEAIAINLNGEYFELANNVADSIIRRINPYRRYQWSFYTYYKLKFEKAKRTGDKGLGLIVAGAGLTAGGIMLVARNFDLNGNDKATVGLFMAIAGPGLFIPGVVFAVKGRKDRVYY